MNRFPPPAVTHSPEWEKFRNDPRPRRLKPGAPCCVLPVRRIRSVEFFAAAVAVNGVRDILHPAVRTFLWDGLRVDGLSAPWAKPGRGGKVLVTF